MTNRFTKTEFDSLYSVAHLQKKGQGVSVSDIAKRLITTARYSMTAAGCAAIAVLGLLFVKPDLAEHVKELSPFATQQALDEEDQDEYADLDTTNSVQPVAAVAVAAAPSAQAPAPALEKQAATAPSLPTTHALLLDNQKAEVSPQQQRVTNWLAKRYRVAKDATNVAVSAAYSTAKDVKMDPLLILAVVAIESRFNPFAESPVGAQGLMQVMSKVHRDKFENHGGVKAALNPVANIEVGAKILKEYVRRGGSVEAGLKMYVGAADAETDSGYGAKVLAEYQRLKDVAGGKKVPTITTAVRPPQKTAERIESPKTEAKLDKSASDLEAGNQPA